MTLTIEVEKTNTGFNFYLVIRHGKFKGKYWLFCKKKLQPCTSKYFQNGRAISELHNNYSGWGKKRNSELDKLLSDTLWLHIRYIEQEYMCVC